MNIFFLIFWSLIIIEVLLCSIWSIAYFKSGIPIYRKVCKGDPVPFVVTSDHKIESLMPDSKPGKILIKYVQDNFFIFREHAYRFGYVSYGYSFIMHGNIIIEPQKGQVQVIGKLNWVILFGIIYFIFFISSLTMLTINKIIILICFIAVLAVMFIYQKIIYDKIAESISNKLGKLIKQEGKVSVKQRGHPI